MPRISVVIPAYNAVNYIGEAMESVILQGAKDLEIIVVDDGSTDGTGKFVQENYPQVRYLFQNNKGPSSARNLGIKEAKGEYIAFLDSDDCWISGKIKLQSEVLDKYPKVGIVACNFFNIDREGNILTEVKGGHYLDKHQLLNDLFVKNVITGSCSGVLIRKECFDKLGMFDEELTGAEDRDMFFRILHCYDIQFIKMPLVKIRRHENNAHKNVEMMRANQRNFIKKNIKESSWILRRKAASCIELDAAREMYDYSRKEAVFFAFLSIINYPFKIFDDDDKYQIFFKALCPKGLLEFFRKEKRQSISKGNCD